MNVVAGHDRDVVTNTDAQLYIDTDVSVTLSREISA
jgi:hypothetical protein